MCQLLVQLIYVTGSYSLSDCMHLTVHCLTCEYGTSLKLGHLTLLTWFYFLREILDQYAEHIMSCN